jgi:hypothetical protein
MFFCASFGVGLRFHQLNTYINFSKIQLMPFYLFICHIETFECGNNHNSLIIFAKLFF